MVQYHKPVKKKTGGSGGKKRASRDKRRAHWGGFFARTKFEAQKSGAGSAAGAASEGSGSNADLKKLEQRKAFRVKGGGRKVAADRVQYANVRTPEGAVKQTRILNVVETPANRHYARENVIVRGAFIDTEAGRARVTSRPGQCGVINAVIVEKEKAK